MEIRDSCDDHLKGYINIDDDYPVFRKLNTTLKHKLAKNVPGLHKLFLLSFFN